MSQSSLLLALLVGLLLASATVIVGSWAFARLWCRPTRSVPQKDPGSHGLSYQAVQFVGKHGRVLRGWFVPAGAGPAVIFIHGWSRNASQLLHLAPLFHGRGLSTLLFDARGHGASDGDGPITILKFSEDLQSALDYLGTRPEVDAHRIGVVGHSIGASAAILAAARDTRIRALVSSSAFADPARLTARVLRKMHLPQLPFLPLSRSFIEGWLGRRMEDVSPMREIGRIDVPLLLTHGEKDNFIPPADLGILHDGARSLDLQMWLVPRRDHSSVLYHRDFGRRVVDFMAAALAADPGLQVEEALGRPNTVPGDRQGHRSIQPPEASVAPAA